MTEDLLSPARPDALLTELRQLLTDTSAVAGELPRRLNENVQRWTKQHADARAEIDRRYGEEKATAQQAYTTLLPAIEVRYEDQLGSTKQQYNQVCTDIVGRFESAKKCQKDRLREAQWEATTVFEAAKNNLSLQLKEVEDRLKKGQEEIGSLHEAAVGLLQQRGHGREFPPPTEKAPAAEQDLLRRFAELVVEVQQRWRRFAGQPLPRLTPAAQVLGVLVAIAVSAVPLIGLFTQRTDWPLLVVGLMIAATILPLTVLLGRAARRHSEASYLALRQIWAEADAVGRQVRQVLDRESQRQNAALSDQLKEKLQKAESQCGAAVAELNATMQKDLLEANTKYPKLLSELTARRHDQLQEADAKYLYRLQHIEETYRTDTERLASDHAREMARVEQEDCRDWEQLAERWRAGMGRSSTALGEINAFCDGRFPDLGTAAGHDWKPTETVPPVVRVGRYELDLGKLEGPLPSDPRLPLPPMPLVIPALLPFPERSTLLLETGDHGAVAIDVLQSIMLRMLTAYPPGKIRFTIIDPIGLGESFSAFMHLADYDEKLVSNRIWTDAQHIEQRLADLSEHMENVIQLFLRNEFETIQQYNDSAGEMAEPYRVLVVANFPANFGESAVRRLVSIINSGARCGVFTVLSLNAKSRLPRDFPRKEIEPHAMTLSCREGEFLWEHPAVGALALRRDPLPEPKTFTELVRKAGRAAKDAAQVEVPFSAIVPAELWSGDSREEIDVPLGRAGARKLQHLRLGKGTAQHVLISGKSGSGKSTLLHVLATNLALRYSPDEIELYLVDFKKGVEFKAYATSKLPHARVVAIESEREFGLSVLQCLDAELQRRGDLFRNHSAQDVKGFRAEIGRAHV
jgi:DNA segregation ATPase FtsK/SpoIIIE, S-DNA-T family